MTFDEYQEAAEATVKYPFEDRVIYPALGLASEAGEVCGKVKKMIRDDGGTLSPKRDGEILDELGDVLWYCAALAGDLGFTLDYVAQRNLDKLASRAARGVIGGSGDDR